MRHVVCECRKLTLREGAGADLCTARPENENDTEVHYHERSRVENCRYFADCRGAHRNFIDSLPEFLSLVFLTRECAYDSCSLKALTGLHCRRVELFLSCLVHGDSPTHDEEDDERDERCDHEEYQRKPCVYGDSHDSRSDYEKRRASPKADKHIHSALDGVCVVGEPVDER